MRHTLTSLVCLLAVAVPAGAQDEAPASQPAGPTVQLDPSFSTPGAQGQVSRDTLSYAVGVQFAKSLQLDKVDLNIEVFTRALQDVMEGRPLEMSEAEVAHVIQAFQRRLQQQLQAERNAAAQEQLAAGRAFLAAYAQRDGVTALPSGVMYRVLREDTGPSPGPNDGVTCHYRGTLVDGTEFDSSYSRGQPATFRVNQVIPGWREALQLMPLGAQWELVIPSEYAYGPQGAGRSIPPNAVLIFEVELLHIQDASEPAAPATQPAQ